jgi:hypothetical protein
MTVPREIYVKPGNCILKGPRKLCDEYCGAYDTCLKYRELRK